MEKTIENILDNGLESISSQLYVFSIGIGIVLMTLGIILFFTNKGPKGKKGHLNYGIICLIIGIASIVCGFIQMP